MTYSEFDGWLDRNCPLYMTRDEFIEVCAMFGALTVINTVEQDGITVSELISNFFGSAPSRLQ